MTRRIVQVGRPRWLTAELLAVSVEHLRWAGHHLEPLAWLNGLEVAYLVTCQHRRPSWRQWFRELTRR